MVKIKNKTAIFEKGKNKIELRKKIIDPILFGASLNSAEAHFISLLLLLIKCLSFLFL